MDGATRLAARELPPVPDRRRVAGQVPLAQESHVRYLQLLSMGAKAHDSNDTVKAAEYYRQAIRMDAQQGEAKYLLSSILYNQGVDLYKARNYTGARNHFRESETLAADATRDTDVQNESSGLLAQVRKAIQALNAQGL